MKLSSLPALQLPPAPCRGEFQQPVTAARPPWPGTEPLHPPCSGLASVLLHQGNTRYQGRETLGLCSGFLVVAAGRKERDTEEGAVTPQAPFPNLFPLSSQPRSCRKMMCLPTSPPALRTCLGLGLFVLLCLGMGKQEPGWECGKGLGTSSSTHGMVNRGWWPSGHSWCLLPGLSPGFGAAGTSLRSPQLPRPLQQAAGSQTGMVISHPSQGERNEGVFGQLMSVGSTWHSPWASVSVAAWFPQLFGGSEWVRGGKDWQRWQLGVLFTSWAAQHRAEFFLQQHKFSLKSCLGCPLTFSEDLP